MGTIIPAERKIIYQEELDYKSGVAERTWFKIGAAINFINTKQHKAYDFKYLGPFRPILGGEDGARGFIENIELVGISGHIRDTGVSGTTILDLHLIRNGADLGSIWSTRLQITAAAADGATFWKNLISADESSVGGITNPIFSAVNLNKGDVIRADLDGNANSAYDLTVNIHYRPR